MFFSAVLLSAALLWANDPPWKGKPCQQWDAQDIQLILTDSPWTRIASVTRNWLPITSKDLPNDQLDGRDRGLPTTASEASSGELNFFVFWASSRVIRAASARKAVLGGKKDLDVEKYANQPQQDFVIILQSADMAPFVHNNEKFFQANSFLEMRKSKLRITPGRVLYQRDPKTTLVSAAVFFFARKSPSGEPNISSDEKLVEFICNLEGTILRVGFEPQKMLDASGPTL